MQRGYTATVTGVREYSYTSKRTGEIVKGKDVWVRFSLDGVIGEASTFVRVSSASPMYTEIVPAYQMIIGYDDFKRTAFAIDM